MNIGFKAVSLKFATQRHFVYMNKIFKLFSGNVYYKIVIWYKIINTDYYSGKGELLKINNTQIIKAFTLWINVD